MAEVEYLCSMGVLTAVGQLHLWATPEMVVLDRPVKKGDPERVRVIPVADIVSIEIDAISDASHHYGWKPTTGFLNSGTNVAAVTGVLVVLADGEHILWRMPGKAPIEVKAELGRLIARIDGKPTAPPPGL